jgi:nucleoside-diphosphate-sugar epimerase
VTFLVTGATGYLGQAIVRALADAGHHAILFARRASQSGLPGTAIDGDIRDRSAVERAAKGVDAICHTAALVTIWRPRREEFDEINVGGLQTVIDVTRALRIPRLVYTSSFLARPPAGRQTPLVANDYQRTKAAALAIARRAAADGVPIATLCPGVIYGPGIVTEGNLVGRLLQDHLAGRLPGIIGPDRIWSFTYIEDVARAHVAALTADAATACREWSLGGDNAPQMRLFEVLRELRNTGLPRRLPYGLASILGTLEEARARLTGRPPLLTRATVEIFRHDWPLDSQPAVETLGYRPTPMEYGVRATLAELSPGARP